LLAILKLDKLVPCNEMNIPWWSAEVKREPRRLAEFSSSGISVVKWYNSSIYVLYASIFTANT